MIDVIEKWKNSLTKLRQINKQYCYLVNNKEIRELKQSLAKELDKIIPSFPHHKTPNIMIPDFGGNDNSWIQKKELKKRLGLEVVE